MSISIDNFSVGIDEWITVSGSTIFTVDVIDLDNLILDSETYFIHNGSSVPTDLYEIDNGYRAYYVADSVVSSGTITITIHAENNIGESVEKSYYLLYGYHVEFNELVDWGARTTVVTTVTASNLAFCPNTVSESVFFETRDLESHDLGAYISPIESVDVGAVLHTQSTAFYYGQTYKVTITGIKDFNGNVMPEYVFEFTIDNPND